MPIGSCYHQLAPVASWVELLWEDFFHHRQHTAFSFHRINSHTLFFNTTHEHFVLRYGQCIAPQVYTDNNKHADRPSTQHIVYDQHIVCDQHIVYGKQVRASQSGWLGLQSCMDDSHTGNLTEVSLWVSEIGAFLCTIFSRSFDDSNSKEMGGFVETSVGSPSLSTDLPERQGLVKQLGERGGNSSGRTL